MADLLFEERRLAAIYDPLHPDRGDLDAYVAIAQELGVHSVLDIGCGTGTFACRLAELGFEVAGLDPAAASLAVARTKRNAEQIRWILGDAPSLPPLQADLVTMTGNVAQVFLTEEEWVSTLGAVSSVLRSDGYLVFETREPVQEAWKMWNRQKTFKRLDLPNVGVIETWVDLLDVSPPLTSFRWTFVFESDGAVLTSESTLRFWQQSEMSDALQRSGFVVDDIRDAPDRPGAELVFIARRRR